MAEARKETLKIYEIAIFLAFFVAFFYVSYCSTIPYKDEFFRREISAEELRSMSAEQYMKMMYWTSDLRVSSILEDWPHQEDIPYLLRLTESQGYTGTAYCEGSNSFSRISRSIINFDTYYGTTESVAAVNLLKAIQDKKFEGYFQSYPNNKDEILDWARAEAEKMESERAVNPRSTPLP